MKKKRTIYLKYHKSFTYDISFDSEFSKLATIIKRAMMESDTI